MAGKIRIYSKQKRDNPAITLNCNVTNSATRTKSMGLQADAQLAAFIALR